MALNIDPKVVSLIIGAVEPRADGATLNDIIASFPREEEPSRRSANRWVTGLVAAGTLRADTSRMPHRYFVGSGASEPPAVANSPAMANSGDMANSDLAMAKSETTSPDNLAKSAPPGEPVAKSAVPAVGGVANSAAGSPEIVAKSPTSGIPVAKSDPAVAKSPDHPHKPARKRAAPAANATLATEATVADLAKSAIEAVMAPATPAHRRAEPAAGIVANSVAKSASQAMTAMLAKSVDPVIPANLRPVIRVAALFLGAVLAIGILTQASLHPWIVAGVAAAAIAGVLIFALLSRRTAPEPESGVAKSVANSGAGVAKSTDMAKSDLANPPGEMAKSASPSGVMANSAPPVAKSAAATTDGTPRTGSSHPDSSAPASARPSDFSVSALADVACGSVQLFGVSPPRRRPVKYLLAMGVVVTAITSATWYWWPPARPAEADVSAWLVQKVAPLPVQVTALSVTYGPVDKVGCVLTYRARLQTTEPLYQRIDTTKYLTEKFAGILPAADQRAATKDNGPTLPVKTLAELGPVPAPALSDLLLVEVKTPPGATTMVSGSAQAWRENDRWVFQNTPVNINRNEIAGEPKPANAFAVESPADSDRLKVLVAEHAAYAAKVQAATATLAVQLERERQQNREALARLLQRGTWFTGVYVDLPKPDSHRVLLEVTDCSATAREITLLARNDGGWFNTRPFRGTWSIADDAESCTAILRTDSFEGIRGAGFLIEEAHATALTLKVRLDGSVSCEPRNWDLQRVADADVAATKAEFGFGRVVAAAAPTSGGPVDQKLGGSAADQPIHRTSDTPPAAATPPPVGGALRPDNPGASPSGASALADVAFGSVQRIGGSGNEVAAAAPLPVLADATPAAYVLGGNWLPLPRNNPRVLQSAPQKLTNIVKSVGRWQDALVGKTTEPSNTPIAELTFDGRTYVTSVSGRSVVIAYVGPLTAIDDGVKARYPELKTYPAIELAPAQTLANGTRHAPLYTIAPGFFGFGPTRIDATLEWVDLKVIQGNSHVPAHVLRCTTPLAAGKYALVCGPNAYELAIE